MSISRGKALNEENKYCRDDYATDSTCTQNKENEHFSNDDGAADSTCTQVCVPMTNESKTHPDSIPVASEQDKSSQRRTNGLNRVSSDTSLEKNCGTSYESAADGIAESDYESSGSEYQLSEDSESGLSESEPEGCERVEDSSSEGSEIIPMVPQLTPPVTVDSTSRGKGKKKHACLFCENLYANMARHITLVHKEEPQVSKILSLPKLTKERKRLWDVLVKKGDFEHNYNVLERGKGAVIPKYRPSSPASHSNGKYIPCQFCRGLYGRKNLWKHQRRCQEKSNNDGNGKRSSAITSGQMLLPIQKTVRAEMYERVILRMKNDHIRAVAEKDETIMAYGQRLFDKHGHQSHKLNYISQKIRELGRLLIEARTISNKIVTLENCVEQGNWDIVVAATKQVAGFNPQSNKFGTPSLALKLGHSLNKCASLISFSGLKNDDELKRKKGETFMKLYSMGWEDAVSTKALSTLVSEKYNKQQLLPLVEDVVKLNSFIREEITKTKKKLDLASTSNFTNSPAYQDLARLCLAQVILFNRKQSGEAQRMTLSGYRSAGTSGGKQLDSVVQTALSTFEKQLCRSHMRVEIEGKRGRKVAVILTDDMKQNLDFLIKHRQAAGVCTTNDLLFAKPGNAVHPIRGSDCLRKFASECGADQPERLTSTKLRKQLATLAQVLNLSENNQDILATFQGQDIRVHREYYRLPESTLQVAKVAKLLHAINTGTIQNYKGMDFEEIEFEDSVPLEKEMDSNDSSSDNDDDSITPTETSTSAGKQRHSRQDPSTAKKRKTTESTGKRCHHQPWTAEEKNFLAQEFKSSIRIERLAGVGKRACEEAKTKAAPLLQSRTWIHIKSQVKNMIERKRKEQSQIIQHNQKESDRKAFSQLGIGIEKKYSARSNQAVNIKVGILTKDDSGHGLKALRGKTIVMRVQPSWSAKETLKEALRKHRAHNSHIIHESASYTLCYESGQKIVHLPEGTPPVPFTVRGYKKQVCVDYQKLKVYLCKKSDFELPHNIQDCQGKINWETCSGIGVEKVYSTKKQEVNIKVGILAKDPSGYKLIALRGKTIVMRVQPSWSAEETLKEALRQHRAVRHSSHNIDESASYALCYESGQKIVHLPEGTPPVPFTVRRYKEQVGVDYQKLKVFLCKESDLELPHNIQDCQGKINRKTFSGIGIEKEYSTKKQGVNIKVGILAKDPSGYRLKALRGKTIVMRVQPSWSAEETLKEALRHHSHVIHESASYTLCYESRQKIVHLPEGNPPVPFTVRGYKEQVGVDYQKLKVFLCKESDLDTVGIRKDMIEDKSQYTVDTNTGFIKLEQDDILTGSQNDTSTSTGFDEQDRDVSGEMYSTGTNTAFIKQEFDESGTDCVADADTPVIFVHQEPTDEEGDGFYGGNKNQCNATIPNDSRSVLETGVFSDRSREHSGNNNSQILDESDSHVMTQDPSPRLVIPVHGENSFSQVQCFNREQNDGGAHGFSNTLLATDFKLECDDDDADLVPVTEANENGSSISAIMDEKSRHTSESHKNKLSRLCRICAGVAQTTKEKAMKIIYKCSVYSKIIYGFYGIDVSSDVCNGFPPLMCTKCYRRIRNAKNMPHAGKTYSVAIKLAKRNNYFYKKSIAYDVSVAVKDCSLCSHFNLVNKCGRKKRIVSSARQNQESSHVKSLSIVNSADAECQCFIPPEPCNEVNSILGGSFDAPFTDREEALLTHLTQKKMHQTTTGIVKCQTEGQSKTFNYLVAFAGDQRKVNVSSKTDIEHEIKRVFKIDDTAILKISFKDPDWNNELVLVDNPAEELPDRARLQVLVVISLDSLSACSSSCSSGEPMIVTPQHSSSPIPIPTQSTSSLRALDSKKRKLPCDGRLPSDYQWPVSAMSRSLLAKLEAKQKLNEPERSSLIGVLMDDLDTNYNKLYCDQNEYLIVTESLFRTYPYLASELPEEHGALISPKQLWKRRIRTFFKNHRQRYLRERPEVRENIAKWARGDGDEVKKMKGLHNKWGLPNFEPKRHETEDDTSVKAHIEWLQNQARLNITKQDRAGVERRCDLTFPDRRKDILKGTSLEEIKEKHPVLFCTEEVLAEFTRLAEKDLLNALQQNIDKYAVLLANLPKRKGKSENDTDELNQAKEAMQTARTEAEKKYATRCAGILSLPRQLVESSSLLLMKEDRYFDEKPTSPMITYGGDNMMADAVTFSVRAGNVLIGSVPSFIDAVGLLLATYFVFNLGYPAKLEGTLTFVQKVIIGHSDKVKVLPKLTTLVGRLHNL